MQIKGTREAFYAIINEPDFANKYGLHKTEVSLFKSGKRIPSLDKMEAILAKAGATVVQEKIWEVKSTGEDSFLVTGHFYS